MVNIHMENVWIVLSFLQVWWFTSCDCDEFLRLIKLYREREGLEIPGQIGLHAFGLVGRAHTMVGIP